MTLTVLIIVCLLCKYLSAATDFQCPPFNKLSISSQSTPFGNISAGRYKKIAAVKSLQECVAVCCEDPNCNIAFIFDTLCFSLECYNYKLCKAAKRSGEKFEKAFVVVVRLPEEKYNYDVSDYEEDSNERSAFEDNYGELKNQDAKDLKESFLDASVTDFLPLLPKPCVYGIPTNCPQHEECIPKNNRARSGICQCLQGYDRDNIGHCRTSFATTIIDHRISSSMSPSGSKQVQNNTDNPLHTTKLPVQKLVVSAGDNVTLQLPENEVTLSAYALKPVAGAGENYKYEWTLISHPDGDETGTMQDQNTKNLKLSKLRAGLYTFKVTVLTINAIGDAMVNVTVLPMQKPNKVPVAVIQPSNVTVKLPNKDTVLDGSFSTDDDKIVKYQWEVLESPIGYSVQLNETPTLQLKNLIPGLYRFKLNVTDSRGAWNFTFANVTVQKETDYPPTANAKSEVVIYLPQNEVTLNGNLSTDDKGIKSWEWKKSPDTDKAVDMEGTNGPYLHLSQLEVGVYKFILKVSDTADQTSTTEMHLFVKPESNSPPIANAGTDQKVTLPLQNSIFLNGTGSKDDVKISKWIWEQIVGPKLAVLSDPNSPVTKVEGFVPGFYEFKLTVYDDNKSQSFAITNITVIQTENVAPKANAGGDKTIYLPRDVIIMNGSTSTDDVRIVKYRWTRDPASLAAGTIIENSDQSSILKLSGLIPGRYLFRLNVYDIQGASSYDTASLIVKPPESILDHIEMMINADIKSFTQEQEDTLLRQLEIFLHDIDPVKVNLIKLDFDRNSRRVILQFSVQRMSTLNDGIISGVDVVSRLKKKLNTDSSLLDVQVLSINTVVCQNKCSEHGICDQYTKSCVCEAFWMQDIFRYNFGDKETNCDWSILYVIIVTFTIVVLSAGILWGITCCLSRMQFRKPKKRHRYTLLNDFNERDREREKFFKHNKTQRNSLMVSESESDAIFESQNIPLNVKTNGIHNGLNNLCNISA